MSGPFNGKITVSIVYVAAMFIAAMDASIVNVALRTISNDLHVSPGAIGVINIGYMVSLAMVLPIAGWLGDRFGTKKVFLSALLVFTLASALCGMADSLTTLTLFRVIQGIGGGLLTPVGMAILFRTFPPEERAKVSRYLILSIALAPALGPIVGGFLVDYVSWRWIFYINLPIGMMALLIGFISLREHKEEVGKSFDLLGFLLSAPGFSMLVYALSQGSALGWSSPFVLGVGLGGLMLIGIFVYVELKISQPMLQLGLLGEPLFRKMGLISFFCAAGLLGMLYVFPLMYQNVFNTSAFDAGLTTFPEALGLMLASQVVPWSYPKFGPKKLISIMLLFASGFFLLLNMVGPETNPWVIRFLMVSAGFSLGQVVGSVQIAAFANIPSAMGQSSTLFTLQNRLGQAIGLALLGSILSGIGTHTVNESGVLQPNLLAYQGAMFGSVVFLLIAFAIVLKVRDAEADFTMPAKAKVKSTEAESV